jgi:hypothetical protein
LKEIRKRGGRGYSKRIFPDAGRKEGGEVTF